MHHGHLTPSTAKGLIELRKRIAAAKVPASKLDETLLLATWNIREFGKKARRQESLHYIAEIIGRFDLVCLVEVRDDVDDLKRVLQYLGPYWDKVFSDYIADPGGNRERVAFVYDSRAVQFTGLASSAEAPRSKKGDEWVDTISWWRPPYIASFQSGNFDFVIVGAHIRWGSSEKRRAAELQMLADWVAKRQEERFVLDKDVVLVGDFNIPSVDGPLYRAITSRGLKMPAALAGLHGSNIEENKRYDQILQSPTWTGSFTGNGGVVDFYRGGFGPLFPGQRITKVQGTFQISDHLPLWMELNTDVDGYVLDQIVRPEKALMEMAPARRP